MARVNIDKVELNTIMVSGEGTMREVRSKAFEIKNAAREVYLEHRKMRDHVDYLNSFEVYRSGRSYIVTNTAETAFWVEFGAHIYPHGNKDADRIHVLGYAPLRTAIDIVSSYN